MRFSKPEPFWLTLLPPAAGDAEAPDGVRVKFAPVTRTMKRQAMRAALRVAGGGFGGAAELTDEQADALFLAGEVSSVTLIRLAILAADPPEWRGVLDAEGQPMPLTEENLDIVLANEEFLEAAEEQYVFPIRLKDAEKNGFAVSPSGIGEAGMPGSGIATSSAASTTTKPTLKGVKAAGTGRPSSRPQRAKKPGAS